MPDLPDLVVMVVIGWERSAARKAALLLQDGAAEMLEPKASNPTTKLNALIIIIFAPKYAANHIRYVIQAT